MVSVNRLESLKKKEKQLKARIQAERQKIKKQKRKNETRKKILIGSFFMQKHDLDELKEMMHSFLTREADRKLFNLDTVTSETNTNNQDNNSSENKNLKAGDLDGHGQ